LPEFPCPLGRFCCSCSLCPDAITATTCSGGIL
jgi:hypothetical protein